MTTAPAAPARDRFSAPAIVLHWAIAALIIYNLYLGLQYDGTRGLAKFQLLQLHKSVGITVLVLSALRLVWRFMFAPPPYPHTMKAWEKALASATHWTFYVLMIGLPLIGWVIVSASPTNIPTLLYKTIPWPHLPGLHDLPVPTRRDIELKAAWVHEATSWIAIALIVLHVAAAIRHQFFQKDGVLYRMLPLPFLRFGTRA